MNKKLIFVLLATVLCNGVSGELLEYFQSVGAYFGYGKQAESHLDSDVLDHSVPYEVSVSDEKFISEAAKLTGVALSELDSCQHRVALRLQTSCNKMNDEQLAKMAVMLLNCQSSVEGRKIYPCTDTMSIKDCTSSMDADTWNSYHLMSNRARAVCYSVRQTQFRGLTEHTVNRLMDAARNQLFTLDKISKDQENLHDMAEQSLTSVSDGQKRLMEQHEDLEKAQLHGQLAIEDNIRRLADEKRLILETHQQLTQMTRSVQGKLEQAASQLEAHADENRDNHQRVLDDLIAIQNKAQIIFQRIEDSSQLLLQQSEAAREQYKATLAQLAEVNSTVHSLVALVGGTRKALEERLAWLTAALGGTDLAVEQLYAIVWHGIFLLLGMVSCAFLGAQIVTRLVVAALPPLNLALTVQQSPYSLDPAGLFIAVVTLVFVQTMIFSIMAIWNSDIPRQALPWIKPKVTPQKENLRSSPQVSSTNLAVDRHQTVPDTYKYSSSHKEEDIDAAEGLDRFDFTSPLSPISRNGSYLSRSRSRTPLNLNGSHRSACGAKTRAGTSCKLNALPGREFCYRHQSGDSIFAG